MKPTNPMSRQVGGNHYATLAVQPAEFWIRSQLPAVEGAVVKYVTRHRGKNGRQDLEKALHFVEMMIWWYFGAPEGERVTPAAWRGQRQYALSPRAYAQANGLQGDEEAVIYLVCEFSCQAHLVIAADILRSMIQREYPEQPPAEPAPAPALRMRLDDMMFVAKEHLEHYAASLRAGGEEIERADRVERLAGDIGEAWRGGAGSPAAGAATTDVVAGETGALFLLADIRMASGDNGRRMQPELVEHIRELARDAERYRWLRGRLCLHDVLSIEHNPDDGVAESARLIDEQIDAARTAGQREGACDA